MFRDAGKALVIIALIAGLAVLYSLRDQERFQVLEKDVKSPLFLTSLVAIVALSIWGLSSSDERVYEAVSKGVIAFVTAYLSRLNMSFAAFFIVVIFAYFTFNWPTQGGVLLRSSRKK